MAKIIFKNISKFYGKDDTLVKALNNVSFEIEDGELVVILGASGAGKSTLLNIMGGMDFSTEGTYLVGDEEVSKFNDKELGLFRRNDIGFVFQFYNLMSNLTALENVEIAASLVDDPMDSMEALNHVGLKDRANNFPSELSGGEQQRVAIARAIVKKPKLLLCDEPTGALDSKTGKSIIQLLMDISKNSKSTVVIVTHNSAIANIADRVIRIKDGEIEENIKKDQQERINDLTW